MENQRTCWVWKREGTRKLVRRGRLDLSEGTTRRRDDPFSEKGYKKQSRFYTGNGKVESRGYPKEVSLILVNLNRINPRNWKGRENFKNKTDRELVIAFLTPSDTTQRYWTMTRIVSHSWVLLKSLRFTERESGWWSETNDTWCQTNKEGQTWYEKDFLPCYSGVPNVFFIIFLITMLYLPPWFSLRFYNRGFTYTV